MAFKLTKEEKTRRDQLVRDLGSLICQIEDEVNNYNAEVEKLRTYVEPVVKRYNALAAEAEGFREDIVGRLDVEYDDKSEKWQDGDRGQEVRSWIDEWENLDLSEIEVEWPDELEIERPSGPDDLEGLSEDVSS
jgi:capsule polysaccharide export protein KpsE/RkpR